jgi:hypothetical protein
MPKLPSRETAFGPDRAPSVQRPIARYTSAGLDAPARAAAEQGEAFARIGGMGFELGRKMVQKEVQKEDAHARSTLLQADVALRAQLPTDLDNFENYEADYRKGLGGVLDTALAGVKNATTRAAIEADFGVMVERGAVAMQGRARERAGEVGRAYLNTVIDKNLHALSLATDPELRDHLIQNTGMQVAIALENGYIGEELAGVIGRNFAIGYVTAWVNAKTDKEKLDVLRGGMTVVDGVRTFEAQGTEIDLLPVDVRLTMIKNTETRLARSALVQARSTLAVATIEVMATARGNPADFATAVPTGMATFNAAAKAALAAVDSEPARSDLEAQIRVDRAALEADLEAFQQGMEADSAIASAEDRIQMNNDTALMSTDPAQQMHLLGLNATIIDNLVEAGEITETFAEEWEARLSEEFAVSWLSSHDAATQVAILSKGATVKDGRTVFKDVGGHTDFIPVAKRDFLLDKAKSDLAALRNAGLSAANSAVRVVGEIVKDGNVPKPDVIADAFKAAAGLPGPLTDLADIVLISDQNAFLRTQTLAFIDAYIGREFGGRALDEFENAKKEAAFGVRTTLAADLNRDPLATAINNGVSQYVNLNPNDPDSVVAARREAEKASIAYGMPVAIITESQAELLGNLYKTKDTAGKLEMLGDFGALKLEGSEADLFYNMINSGAPWMAQQVHMVRFGNEAVVAASIQGNEYIANNGIDERVYEAATAAVIKYGGEMMKNDRGGAWIEHATNIIVAAWVDAEVTKNPAKPSLDDWNTKGFDELALAVIGEKWERNSEDFRIQSGWTGVQFDLALKGLTDADLHGDPDLQLTFSRGPHQLVDGGPEVERITAAQIRSMAVFDTYGDGEYLLLFDAGDHDKVAVMEDGVTPFVFSFDKMESIAAAQRAAHKNMMENDPEFYDEFTRGVEAPQTGEQFMANSMVTPGKLDEAWQTIVVIGLKTRKVTEYQIINWLIDRDVPQLQAYQTTTKLMKAAGF